LLKGKKLVSLILSAALGASLLAGCASSTPTATTPSSTAAPTKTDYPKKSVTILVPFAAGGSADLTARILAPYAEKHLGQSIIIENLAGGGGAVGQNKGATAAPDGYFLTLATTSIVINPLLNETPFKSDDFKGVVQITEENDFLVVQSGKEYKTFEEFIAYAKANPNKIRFGSSGKGTTDDLGNSGMIKATGIQAQNIPFDGSGLATTAILGGHIEAVIGGASSFDQHIKEGKLIPLAVLTAERNPNYPDVPSIKELGFEVYSGTFRGLVVPADTPDEIVAILAEACKKGMEEAEYKTQMTTASLSINYLDSKAFTDKIMSTSAAYKEVLGK